MILNILKFLLRPSVSLAFGWDDAFMIGGGLLSAYGENEKGQANAAAMEYNAKIADENATIAHTEGIENERRVRVQGRKELGSIRAGYGAAGVTMEGSAMDVLQESAANAELDALTTRYNSDMKVRGFKQDAQLARMGASASSSAGMIGAASTILGVGAKLTGKK